MIFVHPASQSQGLLVHGDVAGLAMSQEISCHGAQLGLSLNHVVNKVVNSGNDCLSSNNNVAMFVAG